MHLSDPAISNFSSDNVIHVEKGETEREREVLLLFLKTADLCRQLQ